MIGQIFSGKDSPQHNTFSIYQSCLTNSLKHWGLVKIHSRRVSIWDSCLLHAFGDRNPISAVCCLLCMSIVSVSKCVKLVNSRGKELQSKHMKPSSPAWTHICGQKTSITMAIAKKPHNPELCNTLLTILSEAPHATLGWPTAGWNAKAPVAD